MGENTKIEWCDDTFNPWIGCTKVAHGCVNCYAEAMMDSRLGKAQWGPSGTRVVTSDANWKLPVKWNREAECNCGAAGTGGRECNFCSGGCKRPRVFCASLADVFEDFPGLENLRTRLFALIDDTPYLDWMLLTKRPENIRKMWGDGYRQNIWLYTSISEQESADRNIPLLLECRDLVPVLGVSAEPLLGQVNFGDAFGTFYDPIEGDGPYNHGIDHVIVGGESGPKARPCYLAQVEDIVGQCEDAGVPCFTKQLGSNHWAYNPETETVERMPLKDHKGGDPSEWPEWLRVREMPEVVE